ncbi:MAG TPA: TolC family protein [Candidatus Elarobacter sp.]|nr:TolC family protein [Candidatus Elarobacter sp.]
MLPAAAALLGLPLRPSISAAQRASAPALDEVVAFALHHNPDLQGARLRVDSATAEHRIAASYPNPTLSASPGNPSQYAVGVPVDVGPQRIYRTRAARLGRVAAALDSAEATREVVFSARQAFFDVLLADSLAGLARQQREIFRQLLAADSVRLRSGDIPVRDVARSELELARAEARRQRADAAVRAARIALQLVMGAPRPDTAFTVSGSLQYRSTSFDRDTLMALAERRRPDLQAARERVQQSATLHSLAVAQLLPVPSVGVVYQPHDPFVSGKHVALGVGVQLPIWNWYGGERQRARAGLAISEQAQRRAQLQVESDVTASADAFAAARVLAESYESGLLAKATADLDAARYAYQSGATSLVDLLSAINSYVDIRTEYFTAAHDYWVSAYALDRAVGADVVHGS